MGPGEKPVAPKGEVRSLFDILPPYGGGADHVHLYVCQACGVPSRYTHLYSLPTLVFLVAFAAWRVETVMKCPGCMRRHILLRLPVAVLLANLGSPLIILWWLAVFVKTFFSRPE